MGRKKVLVLPGDGPGPSVMASAERALRAAAPDVDILHGEIGAVAFEHTSHTLPSATMDLLASSDAVLSGPVDISSIGGRDPLYAIRKQLHLIAEVQEFRPLCDFLGDGRTNILMINQCQDAETDVREHETLGGIVSEMDTDDDSLSELFTLCLGLLETAGRERVCLLRGNGMFPQSERRILDSFHAHFAASEFATEDMNAEKAACRLALDPSEFDAIVSGSLTSQFLRGLLAGFVGGSGLMPVAYVNSSKGLFMPSRAFGQVSELRPWNPTSAVLAAADMLRYLKMGDRADVVRGAVLEMYNRGYMTEDVGGRTSPREFTDRLVDLINGSERE